MTIEKCVWLNLAKTQRQTERDAGLNDDGTENYLKLGCFSCDGYEIKCEGYFIMDSVNTNKENLK